MDYVALDLGASNTRYMSVGGKINFIPNNMMIVDNMDENLHNEVFDTTVENNLDVSIFKEGDSEHFPVRVLIGNMASRFGLYQTRPSNSELKVYQRINYISAVMSVALSKMSDSSIGETVNMFIALPPAEAVSRRDILREGLVGRYRVVFNKLGENGTAIEFAINNVACYEESRMAIMQYLFDDKYPERLATMSGENILSIDIGASTTDLVVFSYGRFLDKTGRTYKTGCNRALEYISNEITKYIDYEPSKSEIERILIEGRIRRGVAYENMAEIATAAKQKVASAILADMNRYFNNIEMPLQSFQRVIVSGGGSMESSYIDETGKPIQTVPPMSKFITDEFKKISKDTVEVLHFGDEPRLANIRGIGRLAMMKNGEITD